MSCKHALNFDQWNTLSENYKPMRVWLWLVYEELLLLTTFLQVYSNSKEVSYLSWQNTYPNLKTTSHIKLNFFLWTKLLKNVLLAKDLISVTAPLKLVKGFINLVTFLWKLILVCVLYTDILPNLLRPNLNFISCVECDISSQTLHTRNCSPGKSREQIHDVI